MAESQKLRPVENEIFMTIRSELNKIWKMVDIKARQRAREKTSWKGIRIQQLFMPLLTREGERRRLCPWKAQMGWYMIHLPCYI